MVDVLAFLSYENYASLSYLEIIKQRFKKCIYRKIPKISPSVNKPPKLVTQKTSVKSPVQIYIYISHPGACTRKLRSNTK